MFVPFKDAPPALAGGTACAAGRRKAQAFRPGKRPDRVASIKEDFLVSTSSVFRPAAQITIRAVAVLFATVLATTGPGKAETPNLDPVVAVVNGTQLHESDVRAADEEIGRNLPTLEQPQRREEVIALLIDTVLLSTEATKQKVGDEVDLQRRMAYARNQGLMNQLLVATAERAASDEAVRKTYEDVVKRHPEIELHLRQIIFRADPKNEAATKAAEEKAKVAAQRIANGEDFTAVAREMSADPNSKDTGGDIGWRQRSELGKEYADVLSRLQKGKVSPVFRTAFGVHIIKLEDERTIEPPSFDAVRGMVKNMVMRNAQIEIVQKLRSAAKIERKDRTVEPEKPKDSKG